MEVQKRHRSPNYSTYEINVLLNLIMDFKHIIENKKTDAVTWREKEDAWQDIATRFNACSPGGVLRTSESLKNAYENKKKCTRKAVAHQKMSARRTGGGSGSGAIPDQNEELILSLISDKTVHGIPSPRVNDFEEEIPEHITLIHETDNKSQIFQDVNWGDFKAKNLKLVEHPGLNPYANSPEAGRSTTPGAVQQTSTLRTPSQSSNTNWRKRRRRVVSAVNTANFHSKYSKLAKLKIEYVQMQLVKLKEEREMKNYEHQLTIRSLLLDCEIKEAQLKKLKTTD